jgi:hypothetical protein
MAPPEQHAADLSAQVPTSGTAILVGPDQAPPLAARSAANPPCNEFFEYRNQAELKIRIVEYTRHAVLSSVPRGEILAGGQPE